MRILELSLAGYKSFASRTRFAFPDGITAVIGPNGSGKSNIADAVRWVLGESRPTQLRARTNDDLIFAGTERRARGGLAEVVLTIDNHDGGLGIDFGEVTIGRRAERDGTMTYTINGARVRLRDVQDLVGGRFGHGSYTVIGQGLVDSFVAMRPDQRRALIDDAAGLAPLQRQAERVVRKLADSEDNVRRVRDILADLGPRLRRMERLAERAEQHGAVATALRDHLRRWYGWHEAAAAATLAEARGHADALTAERSEAEARSAGARHALDDAAAAAETRDAELRRRRVERDTAAAALAAARQEAAVASAQAAALVREHDAVAAAEERHRHEADALRRRHVELDDAVAAAEHVLADRVTAVDAARQAQQAADDDRAARLAAADARRAELATLEADHARRTARHATLASAHGARAAEQATAEATRTRSAATQAALADAAAEAHQSWTAADADWTAAHAAVGRAEAALAAETTALAAARDANAEARQAVAELEARRQTLEALFREAGADTHVLEALRAGDRVAVRGTVAELIVTADGWEAAAAAALGPLVRAAVVARPSDIAPAVAALGASPSAVHLAPAEMAGAAAGWGPARGERRADELVGAPEAPGLVAVLLGDVAFVDDLAAAQRAVARPDGPARAATRDGALVRRGGAVTIGAGNRDVLDLARQRRALPSALDAARAAAEAAGATVDQRLDARRALEAELARLTEARADAARARDRATRDRDAAAAALDAAAREQAWATERRDRLAGECAALAAELEREAAAIADGAPRVEAARQAVAAAAAAVAAEADDGAAARAAFAAASQAQAGAAAALAGATAARDAVAGELAAAEARATAAAARRDELVAEAARLATAQTTAAAEADRLEAALAGLESALAAAEEDAGAWRARSRADAESLEASRQAVTAVERRAADALVAVARAEDRLARLAEQRAADAEALEIEPAALAAADDNVAAPDAALEESIRTLRRRLRDIGAIDREALATYHESADHHTHLTGQLADLEAADRDLRTALATLDAEMAAGFETTFGRVAEAFGRTFPRLFGGGEAELALTAADDGPPGIDIVARPPGKRSQPLSLLSGGERALTAVALLFALLEVSGTPFVVLDEVDAALDEANVDRFRACLTALAEHMQVIIVTHNRGTVQSAATVYGVTMAEDGASQVVSLKVEPAA